MPSKKHLFYLVSGLFLAGALSVFATSIGTNVSVSGTLSVTGNSTLAGTVALSGTTGTSTIASGQGFTIGSSQFVVIGSNGNVGISSSSPSVILAIGDSSITPASTEVFFGRLGSALMASDSEFDLNYNFKLGGTRVDNSKNTWNLVMSGDSDVFDMWHMNANNGPITLLSRLTGAGRFGLGTSTPGAMLSVSAATSAPAVLINQTSTGDLLTLQNSGTTRFIVQAGGNLGVGTTSPSSGSNTAIDSNATTTLMLSSSTIGKGACIQLKGPGGAAFRLYATSTGPAVFESGACQ